mgnify:CR=1 FL=1
MITNKDQIKIPQALFSLYPGAQWTCYGDEYDNMVWYDTNDIPKPDEQTVLDEIARLQQEWEDTEYQRLRAKEYPDFKEYLDGIVKGDQEQIQTYIDACLDVKAKYPKPEGL